MPNPLIVMRVPFHEREGCQKICDGRQAMSAANLLIVEHDAAAAAEMQNLLCHFGYGVSGVAHTGEQAIAEVEKSPPQLILMDIQLAGEMDGVEAAEQIRRRFDIPVIYLTSLADDATLSKAKATGPSGFVIKPPDGRELQVAVEMALYQHKTERTLRQNARLNELLLDSLPYPALLVHRDRSILAANRIAREMGPENKNHCWSILNDKCRINETSLQSDIYLLEKTADGKNWNPICSNCRADEALSTGRPQNAQYVEKFGKFWDIWWVPLEKDVFLHYAIDVTLYKEAEDTLKKSREDMERRVAERTRELSEANERLKNEIETRKQMENEIHQSRKTLQSVFDGITDPLMLLKPDMFVVLSNQAAKKYYKRSDDESLAGGLCYNLAKGRQTPCRECAVPSEIMSVIKQNRPVLFERSGIMDPDHYEQVTLYPVPAAEGDTTSVIVRISDVTEAKKMQANLIQNEKLASLGLLISSIAHEINNPNNFITFNIPIMRDYLNALLPIVDAYVETHRDFSVMGMTYPEFRADIFSLLDNIEHGSKRINATISGLKDFARVDEPLKKTLTDLKSVIERAISICRAQINKRVKRLITDIPKNMHCVFINPKALEQVLINLLVNAAQAADKEDAWIRIGVLDAASCNKDIVIEVTDNGCGMDEIVKKKLFDPFFTRKSGKEGTGLGLYVSRTLIEGLGGKIHVESEIGKGSTFRIVLPGGENRF